MLTKSKLLLIRRVSIKLSREFSFVITQVSLLVLLHNPGIYVLIFILNEIIFTKYVFFSPRCVNTIMIKVCHFVTKIEK